MAGMQKGINKAGKKTIESFVRDNLSGRVSVETIQAYVDMAKSNMKASGGLPFLEISMCFSLTGETEYLDLDEDEVAYEDCLMDDSGLLQGYFGKAVLNRFEDAGFFEREVVSGVRWESRVKASFDGYLFEITAVRLADVAGGGGEADFYELVCLGNEG